MNKSTLIIWEEIPENTRLFLVPDGIIHDDLLTEANGAYVNAGDWLKNKGLNAVQDYLFDKHGYCQVPELETKIEPGKLAFDGVMITKVCHTGFLL